MKLKTWQSRLSGKSPWLEKFKSNFNKNKTLTTQTPGEAPELNVALNASNAPERSAAQLLSATANWAKKTFQNFDPEQAQAWLSNTLKKKNTALYGTLITVVFSTYFLSDLTALVVGEMIPNPPPIRASAFGSLPLRSKTVSDYAPILSRNLFNSQGIIPGENSGGGPGNADPGGAPVKTSLPLNLIGTLIFENELWSIATLEDKSMQLVYPVRVDDEIPEKIRILKVEARRVTFLNKLSGRREFIELPEENSQNPRLSLGRSLSPGSSAPGVEKVATNQYNVSRIEVDKALADFNNVLTQARAVPNFENGAASGYKLFQIVPGSIYDKLGLQNGDVIAGLNGTPINDPGKAFEMLGELKNANHLELQVKKDGKQMTYTYDIR
ncbi:MAG: type II secretion system protein GspC [Bdellovibrionia bacterium]